MALAAWLPAAQAQTAGNLDASFGLSDASGDRVLSVAAQPDGKVILGGTFSQIDGAPRLTLARVNGDGSLDAAFVPALLESYNTRTDATITQTDPAYTPGVLAVSLQSTGKVLVGGTFYFVNGASGYGGLVRLNADGTLDPSFKAPRFSGTVFALAQLPNGKILIGGDFSYVGNTRRNALVRLLANGKLDPDFRPAAFAGSLQGSFAVSRFSGVTSIGVLPGGDAIVGGTFTSIGDVPRRGIARIKQDGSVDPNFVPDPNFNPASPNTTPDVSISQVLTVAVQPGDAVLVGGTFADPNTGKPINSLYRLTSAGGFDPTFNAGGVGTFGFDAFGKPTIPTVNSIILQTDGRILIGGDFASYNGIPRDLLARLNADGSIDDTFYPGEGPGDDVFTLALQSDGKLLVGGDFISFNSVARPLVARVHTTANAPAGVTVSISKTPGSAAETGRRKTTCTVTRAGGNLFSSLKVVYSLGGSAENGVDYRKLSGSVTIPGGSSSAVFQIKPFDDAITEGPEKAVVRLTPTAAYDVGAPRVVRIKIKDND